MWYVLMQLDLAPKLIKCKKILLKTQTKHHKRPIHDTMTIKMIRFHNFQSPRTTLQELFHNPLTKQPNILLQLHPLRTRIHNLNRLRTIISTPLTCSRSISSVATPRYSSVSAPSADVHNKLSIKVLARQLLMNSGTIQGS